MNVLELMQILTSLPPDARVVVDAELGFDDVTVVTQPIAGDFYRNTWPDLGFAGPHAQPDEVIDDIPATETAVLIARVP